MLDNSCFICSHTYLLQKYSSHSLQYILNVDSELQNSRSHFKKTKETNTKLKKPKQKTPPTQSPKSPAACREHVLLYWRISKLGKILRNQNASENLLVSSFYYNSNTLKRLGMQPLFWATGSLTGSIWLPIPYYQAYLTLKAITNG